MDAVLPMIWFSAPSSGKKGLLFWADKFIILRLGRSNP